MLKIEWLEVGGNEKPSSRHASSKKHIKIRDKIVVIRHLTHFLTLDSSHHMVRDSLLKVSSLATFERHV